MKRIAILIASLLTILTVVTLFKNDAKNQKQQIEVPIVEHIEVPIVKPIEVQKETSSSLIIEDELLSYECQNQLLVECGIDIAATIATCAAAFSEIGSDFIADLVCARELLASKKHCIPCICAKAQQNGWNILGCFQKILSLSMLLFLLCVIITY